MKAKILQMATVVALLFFPGVNFGQAPNLGSAANFVLFSTNGPLNNTGTSYLTGDIGTNNGTSSGYNNVNGTIHDQDEASALCATDLLAAYNQLNNTSATLIANPILGNGQIITAGAYSIASVASLNGTLILDGQSNTNAVFIIQIKAAFATNAGSQVVLINGAKACNVFFIVEGALGMATGTTFRGTVIANNGAIYLNSGVTIEGRALSTTGAITTNNITAYIPTGCGSSSSVTTQPSNQSVCEGSPVSFSIAATGTALTYQWRKGNVNLINGGNVSGATSAVLMFTAAGVSDIATNYNVVLTGSASPIVVSSNVSLVVNTAPLISTQPINATGCVDYSTVVFSVTATGTGLTYQWRKGLVNLINGQNISGATSAKLTIYPMFLTDTASNYNVVISGICLPIKTSTNVSLSLCADVGIVSFHSGNANNAVTFYPNPFTTSLDVIINDASQINNSELRIYNVLGAEVVNITVTKKITTLETGNLPSGVYFYQMTGNNKTIQSGRLVSQ